MKISTFSISLLAMALMTSCKKDASNNVDTTVNVSSNLSAGTWRITYYFDSDHEETNSFGGYNFTFGDNNVVTAVKVGNTVSGSWTTGTDDSKTKLMLNFTNPASFTELSDDWEVTEQNASVIKLRDVSGGNGGTDLLTFEKN